MRLPRPSQRILLPIRARLAIWYSLLLGLVLILFSFLVYSTLTTNLLTEVDLSLHDRAEQIKRQSSIDPRRPILRIPAADSLAGSDMLVQVTGTDGQIVTKSDNLGTYQLPLGQDVLNTADGGQSEYQTLVVGDQRLRLYNAPLLVNGRTALIIQVARVLKPVEDAVDGLRLVLAVGSLLAIIAALGLGWLTSGQALRPLERVSRTAEHIGQERDFTQRVPYNGPPDEVGRLAATFNAMLDQLQAAYAGAQEAAHQAQVALTAQRRFVGDASHELRTPLTAIRGNAEFLQRVPHIALEDREQSIAEIVSQSQRMSRLVGDLLELARADAGQQLRKDPVAIAPLVRECYAEARYLPGGCMLALAEPVATATVQGDADYLKQLLLILLDNAIKYTPEGGHVELSTALLDGHVAIAVADTGCGIDPADLPHVFERFYRADRARAAGGTGLGLSIAGWIVAEHGGQIRAQSAPGAGSTFTIVLPVVAAAEERAEAALSRTE
jgi:two-component system, OmpR family, sensor kinase